MKKTAITHFAAKPGAHISNADANIVGLEIRRLTEEAKRKNPFAKGIKAIEVVEAAADPLSPLHKFFEWSDKKAGLQWRIQQARVLMGAVVPVIHNGAKVKARAFRAVTVRGAKDQATRALKEREQRQYIEIRSMKNNSALRDQVTDQFVRDLQHVVKRYEHYRGTWVDFDVVFNPISSAVAKANAPALKKAS